MSEQRFRVVQVGAAPTGIGTAWLSHLQQAPDWDLVGVVDVVPEHRTVAAERANLSLDRSFESIEAAAQAIEFEAVVVVVPSPLHARVVTQALYARKHVIVEKPFALSLEDARAVVDLADQQGVQVMVDQNYRYMADMKALRRAVQEEIAGRTTFVSLGFNCDWRARTYQDGMANTMLLEMAIHHFDSLRFVLGTNPQQVVGRTWRPPWTRYAGDTWVSGVFSFPEGIQAQYHGSLEAPGAGDPWQGVWRVECERGALHLGDHGNGYGLYRSAFGADFELLEPFGSPPDPGSAIAGTLGEFAAALRDRRAPQSSGADNLQTLAMAFGISRSSDSGRAVDLQRDYFDAQG